MRKPYLFAALVGLSILGIFLASAITPARVPVASAGAPPVPSWNTQTLWIEKRSRWIVDNEPVYYLSQQEYDQNSEASNPEWDMYYLVGCGYNYDNQGLHEQITVNYWQGGQWHRFSHFELATEQADEPGQLPYCFQLQFAPSDFKAPSLVKGPLIIEADGPLGRESESAQVKVLVEDAPAPPPTPIPPPTSVPDINLASLTTNPTEVHQGDSLSVMGQHFHPPAAPPPLVRFYLDSRSGTPLPGSAQEKRDGTLQATITIPATTAPGPHNLVAVAGNGESASAPITVVAAGQSASPMIHVVENCVSAGGSFTLVGEGFASPPLQMPLVSISLDTANGQSLGGTIVQADGSFRATLKMPAGATAQDNAIVATEAVNGQTVQATTSVCVLATPR